IERLAVELRPGDARTHVVATVTEPAGGASLDEAPVVVAAGQGVGCRENMALLEELAKTLGAALGATRPVVDAGWLPESVQVGQSGKTVRPRLYIACGVHGASFHAVGMQNSDIIVAINDEPQAPIFKIATLGIDGDLREIVPLLTKKLKEAGI
ncbi:MAG: electron transfer flavoprotein subunit alpha/FixB family protein, partial [Dehalococcoidia bacterium]|nr:electron transfer flavoprotein subunit alpha/FixB family protein [Dehalococcoidia bacterium]